MNTMTFEMVFSNHGGQVLPEAKSVSSKPRALLCLQAGLRCGT